MIDNIAHITSETDKAIEYLKDTDATHAALKAELASLNEIKKTIHAFEFLSSDGPVEQRKAKAYTSAEYRAHIDKIKNTQEEYELVNNKRNRAMATIELFRTLSANQRRGNI